MEDKIKIYISEKTARILDKDAELFEFRRKDGKVNRNAFLNTLILNYFETYQNERSSLLQKIRQELSDTGISPGNQAYISLAIMDLIAKDVRSSGRLDVTVSLKPTKKSSDLIRYIEAAYLEDSTLSGYFRDMFISYASIPQDEREKIIFREQYEVINEAIRLNRKLAFISTRNPELLYVVSPYAVASAKEELFNYLLASYRNYPYTFRLSRIRKAMISAADTEISDSVMNALKRMEKYGPQYAFYTEEEICVQLTDLGKRKFETFYIHRPVPERIEDNLYYFRCSANQVYQYFCRYGKDAIVLYPEKLQAKLLSYYAGGYRAYMKAAGEEKS